MRWLKDENGVSFWNKPFGLETVLFRNEDHWNSEPPSRACSASFLDFLVVQAVWDLCQLACYAVWERAEFLANFNLGKFRCQSRYIFWTACTVMTHLWHGVRKAIRCSSTDISFHYWKLQRYEMETRKQNCTWPVLWQAGLAVLPLSWRDASWSGMVSCIKTFSISLGDSASKVSKIALKDLFPSSCTSNALNTFWSVTLRQALR